MLTYVDAIVETALLCYYSLFQFQH